MILEFPTFIMSPKPVHSASTEMSCNAGASN